MIRPLRRRHRHIVIALGVSLPVALAMGLAARRPPPEILSLPDDLGPAVRSSTAELWSRADVFPKSPVRVRLLRATAGPGTLAVALSAADDFIKPDLLVYWLDGNPGMTSRLPDKAILLGAFNAPQLPLPAAAEKTSGVLALYSLADEEMVDLSKPIQLDGLSR